jgi:hypothetical protein
MRQTRTVVWWQQGKEKVTHWSKFSAELLTQEKKSVDDKIPNEQYDKDGNCSHELNEDVTLTSQHRNFFEGTIIWLSHKALGSSYFLTSSLSMYLFLQHHDPWHVWARLGAVPELTFVYAFGVPDPLYFQSSIVTCFESASVESLQFCSHLEYH